MNEVQHIQAIGIIIFCAVMLMGFIVLIISDIIWWKQGGRPFTNLPRPPTRKKETR